VSTAFSEILASLGDKREEDEAVVSEEGATDEEKPRRIKRMRTRITSWFSMPKRAN
jgi:hypothetical protein